MNKMNNPQFLKLSTFFITRRRTRELRRFQAITWYNVYKFGIYTNRKVTRRDLKLDLDTAAGVIAERAESGRLLTH